MTDGLHTTYLLLTALLVGSGLAVAKDPAPTARFRPAAVRYLVTDVDRSVAFYTQHLGFTLDQKRGPVAMISLGTLRMWLSGPEASGARPMPDGRKQEPGGWNRIALEVDDLPAVIETLTKAGLKFRNQMESGPGGKQIHLLDPDGNPIELFQPAAKAP